MPIQVEHLTHTYMTDSPFAATALEDVSLTIEDGELIGLLGHTGSGKTTLVQHLNGLLKPTSGKVVVDGLDITEKDVSLLEVRRRVGLVFQYPEYQLFEETVAKDVAFGPKNLGLSEQEVDERVRYALQEVGLVYEDIAERSPFELSGGQMRRVAIAGVLAMRPKTLILDEPTNGLDIPSKTILRSLLAAYADEKRTIVISTHQVREVENLIDKIVILDEQGLVLAATTEELSHRLTFGPLPADAKAIYSTPSFSGEEGIALNTTGRESRPDLELIFAATTHDRMTIPSILHTNPTNHE